MRTVEGTFLAKNSMFLPESYFENGRNDIGMIKVVLRSEEEEATEDLVVPLSSNPVGNVLVGEGKVFVRGLAVGVLPDYYYSGRMLVDAMSVSGCGSSGSPLFDPTGNLCGILLHGETKHRGQHSDHSSTVCADIVHGVILNEIDFEPKTADDTEREYQE